MLLYFLIPPCPRRVLEAVGQYFIQSLEIFFAGLFSSDILLHTSSESEHVPIHVIAVGITCEALGIGRSFVVRIEEADLVDLLDYPVGDYGRGSIIVGFRVVLRFLREVVKLLKVW